MNIVSALSGMLLFSSTLNVLSMEKNKDIITIVYKSYQLENVRKDWFSATGNMTKPSEDRYSIVPKNDKEGFFAAVYDGNAGSFVAHYLKEKLHEYFFHDLAQQCGVKSVDKAFSNAFQQVTKEIFLPYKKNYADIKSFDSYPGSTAVCVYIDLQNRAHFSWVGDSRGILGECSGESQQLKKLLYATKDHNVYDENEKKRVENKGGLIELHEGIPYVNEIAMTRVIGAFDKTNLEIDDKKEHMPQGYGMIISDPTYHCVSLEKDKVYTIILTSDGLTERVSDNNEILNKIFVKGICRLAQEVRQNNGNDDITVIEIEIKT